MESQSLMEWEMFNNGAPAKIALPVISENPFKAAHDLEFSGDTDNALDLYRDIIANSDNPYYRRKAIKSIMRINGYNIMPFGKIREMISDEIAIVDNNYADYSKAFPWYRPSLEFLLLETYVQDAMQKEAPERERLLQIAANEFERTSMLYNGGPTEVEMLARVANIYGNFLNDPIKAKQYADRAAQINPGQPILRSAYYSANEKYKPSDYENIYADQYDKYHPEPPIEPQTEQVVENSVSVFPNPANPVSNIAYSIAEPSQVKLDIYSITGQKVAALVDDYREAGVHTAVFDGSNLASGLYLYRFQSKSFSTTGRLMIVK